MLVLKEKCRIDLVFASEVFIYCLTSFLLHVKRGVRNCTFSVFVFKINAIWFDILLNNAKKFTYGMAYQIHFGDAHEICNF